MLSNDRLIRQSFYSFYCLFNYSWSIKIQLKWYKLLLFLWVFIHQLLLFGVFVIISALLIVDLTVHIDRISVNWSWNSSLGVIANFLLVISKPDIRIFLHRRFVEGHGKGVGWVFRLVCFNWLLFFIKKILQLLCSSLILLIFQLCVSYLFDQHPLIPKLVLGCECKFPVWRIQTGHINLLLL